jgi:hypothetical protein
MEQTECSETSAHKIQTPGNNPEESIQHLEPGESLKSRNQEYETTFRKFTLLCSSLGGRIVMFLTTGFLMGEIVGIQINCNHIFLFFRDLVDLLIILTEFEALNVPTVTLVWLYPVRV